VGIPDDFFIIRFLLNLSNRLTVGVNCKDI
jgi:hypothetical protein